MGKIDLGRVMPIYRKLYEATRQYELNDIVLYEGSLYWHCGVTPTSGIAPTDTSVWQMAFDGGELTRQIHAEKSDAEAWAVGKRDGVDVGSTDEAYQNNAKYYAETVGDRIARVEQQVASPFVIAATAADMTDTSKAYVYVGRETSYVNGGWYYWDGSAWTLGDTAVDHTLTVAGAPADAAATGMKISEVENRISAVNEGVRILTDAALTNGAEKSGEMVNVADGVLYAKLTAETEGLAIKHTGKNLLTLPYEYTSPRTINGVTLTPNADGSVRIQGTATQTTRFTLILDATSSRRPIKAGTYTLSDRTYRQDGVFYTLILTNVGQDYLQYSNWAAGLTKTITQDTTFALLLNVRNGITVDNVYYPMLELGTKSDTWEAPVAETITLSNGKATARLFDGVNVFSADQTFTASYRTRNAENITNVIDLKSFGAVGDGITDDTNAINSALTAAEGKTLYVPSGTYVFSESLVVKSGTHVVGEGQTSIFKLADTFALSPYAWRPDVGGKYGYRYPMMATEENAQGCIFENFSIEGQESAVKDENEDGLCLRGSQHVARNLKVTKINYFPDTFSQRTCITPGIGLCIIFANTVLAENITIEDCGYENFGVENSENVTITNCRGGTANQTSIQVHRSVSHCRITFSVFEKTGSCLTMDADPATPMRDVQILSNSIAGTVVFVAGGENEIHIGNNKIGGAVSCNNSEYRNKLWLCGNYISGRVIPYFDQAIITGNNIYCSSGYYMIVHHGNNSVVKDNIGSGSVTDTAIETH